MRPSKNRMPIICHNFAGDMMAPSAIRPSVELQKKLTELRIEQWLADDVFHARWWILIGLLIVLCIAWFLLLDKARAKEACLFLVLAIIVVLGIDEYGVELILWEYPTRLTPIFPPLISVKLFSMPLIYSIAFQRFPALKRYTIAVVILTAIISFVLEPLLAWGKLYTLVNWRHVYSFCVYLLAALTVRFLAKKLLQIEQRARSLGQINNGRAEDEHHQ